jgi:hypothetical protein
LFNISELYCIFSRINNQIYFIWWPLRVDCNLPTELILLISNRVIRKTDADRQLTLFEKFDQLIAQNSDPKTANSEKPRNLRSASFSLKPVKFLDSNSTPVTDKKLGTSKPNTPHFKAETTEKRPDTSVNFEKPKKMADDAVVTLLRQTVTQIQDMYDQRPVTVISPPILNSFAADGDSNWTEWERQFSNISILAGAIQLEPGRTGSENFPRNFPIINILILNETN